jgi:hypothetical protein
MTRLETTMVLINHLLADPPPGLVAWADGKVDDWQVIDWLTDCPARSADAPPTEWRLSEDAWKEAWAHLEDLHEVPDAERLQVVHDWRERQGAPR